MFRWWRTLSMNETFFSLKVGGDETTESTRYELRDKEVLDEQRQALKDLVSLNANAPKRKKPTPAPSTEFPTASSAMTTPMTSQQEHLEDNGSTLSPLQKLEDESNLVYKLHQKPLSEKFDSTQSITSSFWKAYSDDTTKAQLPSSTRYIQLKLYLNFFPHLSHMEYGWKLCCSWKCRAASQ